MVAKSPPNDPATPAGALEPAALQRIADGTLAHYEARADDFWEGTRGHDYSLRPFKKGPFVLAIAAQAPVVPVLVYGAREVMPKGTFKVRSATVHVHFLEAVDTTGLTYDRRHQLMRVVWGRIEAVLRKEYGIGTSEHPISESTTEQTA